MICLQRMKITHWNIQQEPVHILIIVSFFIIMMILLYQEGCEKIFLVSFKDCNEAEGQPSRIHLSVKLF